MWLQIMITSLPAISARSLIDLVRAEVRDGVHLHVVADRDALEASRLRRRSVRHRPLERGRNPLGSTSRISAVADHDSPASSGRAPRMATRSRSSSVSSGTSITVAP